MSQAPKPSHEHKLMQPQWTLDVPSKRILKNVSWCNYFKMKSSNHLICFSIKCSNEGNTKCKGYRKSQATFNYYVNLDLCWVVIKKCENRTRLQVDFQFETLQVSHWMMPFMKPAYRVLYSVKPSLWNLD
jgi:hypothetical protein